MEHSKNYEMVKRWFESNRPISWIRNAVVKKFITKDEFEEITGEPYKEDTE